MKYTVTTYDNYANIPGASVAETREVETLRPGWLTDPQVRVKAETGQPCSWWELPEATRQEVNDYLSATGRAAALRHKAETILDAPNRAVESYEAQVAAAQAELERAQAEVAEREKRAAGYKKEAAALEKQLQPLPEHLQAYARNGA